MNWSFANLITCSFPNNFNAFWLELSAGWRVEDVKQCFLGGFMKGRIDLGTYFNCGKPVERLIVHNGENV